jgi:hypothetical protein
MGKAMVAAGLGAAFKVGMSIPRISGPVKIAGTVLLGASAFNTANHISTDTTTNSALNSVFKNSDHKIRATAFKNIEGSALASESADWTIGLAGGALGMKVPGKAIGEGLMRDLSAGKQHFRNLKFLVNDEINSLKILTKTGPYRNVTVPESQLDGVRKYSIAGKLQQILTRTARTKEVEVPKTLEPDITLRERLDQIFENPTKENIVHGQKRIEMHTKLFPEDKLYGLNVKYKEQIEQVAKSLEKPRTASPGEAALIQEVITSLKTDCPQLELMTAYRGNYYSPTAHQRAVADVNESHCADDLYLNVKVPERFNPDIAEANDDLDSMWHVWNNGISRLNTFLALKNPLERRIDGEPINLILNFDDTVKLRCYNIEAIDVSTLKHCTDPGCLIPLSWKPSDILDAAR